MPNSDEGSLDSTGLPSSIACPVCGLVSHHPEDVRWGYCSNCKLFTQAPWDVRRRANKKEGSQ